VPTGQSALAGLSPARPSISFTALSRRTDIGICNNHGAERLLTYRPSLTRAASRPKIPAHDRANHFALPHRRAVGRRWDGCGFHHARSSSRTIHSVEPMSRHTHIHPINCLDNYAIATYHETDRAIRLRNGVITITAGLRRRLPLLANCNMPMWCRA
jgi:hypothetical protein